MTDTGKKVEVRFGTFSCSIEGYDDPVERMREVLLLMQQMIRETPMLSDYAPEIGDEQVARIESALSRNDAGGDAGSDGIVVMRSGGRALSGGPEDAVTTAEFPPGWSEDREEDASPPEDERQTGLGMAAASVATVPPGETGAAPGAPEAERPLDDETGAEPTVAAIFAAPAAAVAGSVFATNKNGPVPGEDRQGKGGEASAPAQAEGDDAAGPAPGDSGMTEAFADEGPESEPGAFLASDGAETAGPAPDRVADSDDEPWDASSVEPDRHQAEDTAAEDSFAWATGPEGIRGDAGREELTNNEAPWEDWRADNQHDLGSHEHAQAETAQGRRADRDGVEAAGREDDAAVEPVSADAFVPEPVGPETAGGEERDATNIFAPPPQSAGAASAAGENAGSAINIFAPPETPASDKAVDTDRDTGVAAPALETPAAADEQPVHVGEPGKPNGGTSIFASPHTGHSTVSSWTGTDTVSMAHAAADAAKRSSERSEEPQDRKTDNGTGRADSLVLGKGKEAGAAGDCDGPAGHGYEPAVHATPPAPDAYRPDLARALGGDVPELQAVRAASEVKRDMSDDAAATGLGRFSVLLARLGGRTAAEAPAEQPDTARVVVSSAAGAAGPAGLAERAGATSVPELLAAAAAWLTLVEGKPRFTRREVMEIFEGLPGDHARTLEARIKGFGQLLRSGTLLLVADGVFAMAQSDRDRFQAMIERD